MLHDAFRGRGGVAVIGGAMAGGKTTLLHAFCDEAVQQGALVLSATASREEQDLGFAVVHQLLRHAPEPVRKAAEVRIRQSPAADGAEPDAGAHPDRSTANSTYALGSEMLALAGERPVVVAIDDAQFLDGESLQCLLVVARRIRSARMLIVATNCGCSHHRCRRFLSRLEQLFRVRHLRLDPLTVPEVQAALRERLGAAGAALARSCHEITGGNRLLVHALAQDATRAAGGDHVRMEPGPAFRGAVLACIGRCSPEGLAVLHTIALLGGSSSTARIAALIGADHGTVAMHLHELEAAGLLIGVHFRQPAIAAAVVESMPAGQRRATHQRLARLLHEENAAATVIAHQLIAAGVPALPWATDVLGRAAGEQAQDDPQTALQYLTAARRMTQDADERASLTMMLVSIGWRTNPGAIRQYVPELVHLLDDGRLSRADAELAIRYLLWCGRLDEAGAALERLLASVPADDPAHAVRLRPFVLWLSVWYPGVVRQVPVARELRFSELLRSEAVGARVVEAGNVSDLLLRNGERREVVAEAERLLESWRLNDHTLHALVTALVALLSADELDSATQWCDALIQEAHGLGAHVWQSQLTGLRAEIAFRQGRIVAAAGDAASAYTHLPPEEWGVWVGLPLSTLVRVHTVLGEYERAAEILDKPVPSEMFETAFGMFYLQARGQFLLATGHLQRARVEFQACWDFMRLRSVDLPNVLPWRTHLAEVHLRLGEPADARSLAEEQAATAAGRGHWTRGVAQRLLAGTESPERAQALLEQSAEELQAGGAQLELAWTLADLARCQRAQGETRRAAHAERRAAQLAAQCGLTSLPDDARGGEPPARRRAAGRTRGIHRLSAAEQRVAVLAVQELTNTQISQRLHLTVSTVEQHLTHVYRKLEIQGRPELASALDLLPTDRIGAAPDSAAEAVRESPGRASAVGSR